MGIRYQFFTFGCLLASAMGLLPILLTYGGSRTEVLLAAFCSLAWFIVGVLLMRHRHIFLTVRRAIDAIGLDEIDGGLTEVISQFSHETTRYHRAGLAFRLDNSLKSSTLSQNLARIAYLAYFELDAQAVELSLFDEESDLWSQAILIGEPKSSECQSMLATEQDRKGTIVLDDDDSPTVVCKPVTFAGSMFGAIRVELRAGAELNTADRQVLHLLTTQGGILLVDSRFTDEVIRLRRLSDETTRAKTGFLANLSHELRGPLGIILNGVELSLDGLCGPVSDSLSEMLKMIKDSGDHLLDLVNDVLDYAKVEAGKVTANPIEIALKPLLEDLTAVVRTEAVAKKHTLTLEEVDPSIGVLCDKRHIRQMLINFLTNAVKYTPDNGSVTVRVSSSSENRVQISIQDTGIGIPESQHDKVFGAFERVEHQYAMSQVGTGLGMPLTRRLAEVNGGLVGFESVENAGSTFWLKLPAVEIVGSCPEDLEDEDGQIIAQGHGENILLVDHEIETSTMIRTYLVEHGFNVFQAVSGAEVMKVLREHSIDLAVVENDLPDLPGEEMVAAIRATPSAISIPIILLSAKAFVFDIERFLKLGVDRCLSKPVALSELALNVRRLVDENRNLGQEQLHPH